MEERKKKLWLTCGIPGIGKSTWIQNHKEHFKGTCTIVSRDKIRFEMLKDDELYFSRENEVWAKFINDINVSLKMYDNTIVDATHLSPVSRSKVLRSIKKNLKNVEINIIVFIGDLNTALIRNDQRSGRAFVPHSVIRRMSEQMIMPTFDEDFDKIIIINVDTNTIIEKIKE